MSDRRPINPTVVCTPDGEVGVLLERQSTSGYIEIRGRRALRSVPLAILKYHLPSNARTRH